MEFGSVPGIDKPVSRLVQGTVMLDETDATGCFALLDGFVDLGGTAVDTARHYSHGNEAIVGRWVRERSLQDNVVIIGKGAHPTPEVSRRVTPEAIAADLDESLRQFKLDTIDLYLLHRDDPDVPVGPIVEALNEHLRAGKIRAFGGSNWAHTRIAEANAYAEAHGLVPFVASSPHFSLVEQVEAPWPGCIAISGPANKTAQDWYLVNQMPVFAWSSLAGGFLSGALTRESNGALPEEAAQRARRAYGTDANFARLDRARTLAADRGLTVAQIALAYALSQPLNLFTIAGAESGDELVANAAAVDAQLTDAERAWLDLRQDAR